MELMKKKLLFYLMPLILIGGFVGIEAILESEVEAQTPPAEVQFVVGESATGKRAVVDLIFQDDDYFELDDVTYDISIEKDGNKLDLTNQFSSGFNGQLGYSANHESSTIPQVVSVSEPLTVTVTVISSENGAVVHNVQKQYITTEPLIIPTISITTFVDAQPNGIDFRVNVLETGQTGGYDMLVTQAGETIYEVANWKNAPYTVNPYPHWTDELVVLPSESAVVIRITPEHGQILNQVVDTDE